MPNYHHLTLPNGDVAVYDDQGKGYRNPYLYTIKAPHEDDEAAEDAYRAAAMAYAVACADPDATDAAIDEARNARDAAGRAWFASRVSR